MKIIVIDGQGGRIGSLFIEKLRQKTGLNVTIIGIGTNSIATTSMLKAGADKGATGENPVVVNVRDADYIVGPIGILGADALLGEVTEKMALAIARSSALKLLIPVNACQFQVIGVKNKTLKALIEEAVEEIVNKKRIEMCEIFKDNLI